VIALDSSALVAVALDELESKEFQKAISKNRCYVGWPTLLETYFVLYQRVDPAFAGHFLRATSRPNFASVPFDEPLFEIARAAFDRFGRGHHPAKLNFGDCMSYAVAKFHDVPLLFKGGDFRLTDIRAALP
jgi:ribonuclease VapC